MEIFLDPHTLDRILARLIDRFEYSSSGGMCWMNNPWNPILTSAVIAAIIAWLPTGRFQVAYWEP
jgi:hypothetical protein